MENENQLQVNPTSPMAMAVELCKVNSDMSIEKMEKILEMQERFEANQARKDFTSDFAIVQAAMDAVVKTKTNPQTQSKYAGLDDVLKLAKPVYTKHGFSVIFYEGKSEDTENVRVCVDVLHKAGHKETYHLDVPMGGVGIQGKVNMTKIHAKATSVTYGRRYLLCMIWNIPTQDDDGNVPGDTEKPKPNKAEEKVLKAICDKMIDSVPEGLTLIDSRVDEVLFAMQGRYPDDMKKVGTIAAAMISLLNKKESWGTVTKETRK